MRSQPQQRSPNRRPRNVVSRRPTNSASSHETNGAGALPVTKRVVRVCAECGHEFEPRRTNQKFCAAACRQAAYRERKRYAYEQQRDAKRQDALRAAGRPAASASWSSRASTSSRTSSNWLSVRHTSYTRTPATFRPARSTFSDELVFSIEDAHDEGERTIGDVRMIADLLDCPVADAIDRLPAPAPAGVRARLADWIARGAAVCNIHGGHGSRKGAPPLAPVGEPLPAVRLAMVVAAATPAGKPSYHRRGSAASRAVELGAISELEADRATGRRWE